MVVGEWFLASFTSNTGDNTEKPWQSGSDDLKTGGYANDPVLPRRDTVMTIDLLSDASVS